MKAINLKEKLSLIPKHWSPEVVAQFNGHDVMLVKAKGEFSWHSHENIDACLLVLSGRVTIEMREDKVTLEAGEMFVVPKGVEHRPVAEEESHLLLIEPTRATSPQ